MGNSIQSQGTAKRAAIYARVSTDEQANNYSLPSQLEYCRKHAAEHSYSLSPDFEFSEEFTGTVTTRPVLDKLREVARAGKIDAVIVLELDRLGRGLAVPLVIEDEFKLMGVSIEYVLEVYDDTPEGALKKGLRATISEFERLKIKERTKRGRIQKAESGSIIVAKISKYGYSIQRDGRKRSYVIAESEAKIIRLIFEWYAIGDESGTHLKASQIARRLTEMKVPTRIDTLGGNFNIRKRARYGSWGARYVNKILRDRAYIGEFTYGQTQSVGVGDKRRLVARDKAEQIKVAMPAIVPLDLWNAAQQQVNANMRVGNARNNTKSQYLMRSRLKCERCGGTFQYKPRTGLKNDYPYTTYYTCNGARACASLNYEQTCHGLLNQTGIDAAIWDKIVDVLKNPELIAAAYRQRQEDAAQHNSPINERISIVRAQMAAAAAERSRNLDLYLSGSSMPRELLEARTVGLNATIKACETELADLEGRIARVDIDEAQLNSLLEYCDRIAHRIDLFTFEDRQRVIELLDVRGIVRRDEWNYTIELTGTIPELPIITGKIKEPVGIAAS